MKTKTLKLVSLVILFIGFSCDEPETIVTNTVHEDGSVTRKIEMRNTKNLFKPADLQVPFDSTWVIKDTVVIGAKKDTTWIKTAEKLFKNADEINKSYLADNGANKEISRKTAFIKKFRWFSTLYRFSEVIDRQLKHGYPLKDFLNNEELNFFYSPGFINSEKINGADSLKYKALDDTIKKKNDLWLVNNFFSEWIFEFSRLTGTRAGAALSENSLKSQMDKFIAIAHKNENKFDSLWAKGIILKEMIGEDNAVRFKTEGDSALAQTERLIFISFKDYSVRIVMPGKVIGTNGYIDKTEVLLWPVKSDFFITQPYEMWAESKVTNNWAWIVTGIFILFVATGLLIRLFGSRKR